MHMGRPYVVWAPICMVALKGHPPLGKKPISEPDVTNQEWHLWKLFTTQLLTSK